MVAAISSTLPFAANNTWAGPKFKLTHDPTLCCGRQFARTQKRGDTKFAAAAENGGISAVISV
jgi:hypothetical protein